MSCTDLLCCCPRCRAGKTWDSPISLEVQDVSSLEDKARGVTVLQPFAVATIAPDDPNDDSERCEACGEPISGHQIPCVPDRSDMNRPITLPTIAVCAECGEVQEGGRERHKPHCSAALAPFCRDPEAIDRERELLGALAEIVKAWDVALKPCITLGDCSNMDRAVEAARELLK